MLPSGNGPAHEAIVSEGGHRVLQRLRGGLDPRFWNRETNVEFRMPLGSRFRTWGTATIVWGGAHIAQPAFGCGSPVHGDFWCIAY